MQLQFTGRHIDLTPALKQFTTEKFQRLEKFFKEEHPINIVLHVEHATHIAEATLHIDKIEIHANAKSGDMYQAIDELVSKLQAQIVKHKEKLIDHHRQG